MATAWLLTPPAQEIAELLFLTVVILTKDEEKHIGRAIESVKAIADRIFVVDSGSTDSTRDIAESSGASVLEHPWKNYASQFNWALEQLPSDTQWVLRLDADEIVTEALKTEIKEKLPAVDENISGIVVGRRMKFMGRIIRHGGIFPIRVLRIFRHKKGRCEDRWMDEHIIVDGNSFEMKGEIIDDNRNSIGWWTNKHNAYASREAIDLLNLELRFIPQETVADLSGGQAGIKRWLKERIYAHLPYTVRPLIYFFYRYFLRFGFLDGTEGLAFHFLQGLWYRYLVDIKIIEVKRRINNGNMDAKSAIRECLGIEV